jgi:8-oxo-dGTP pyrophosphatase MutT (NUDIX family)
MNDTPAIPEFGIKRENEERRDGGCGIVFDPKSKKYAVGKQHENGSFRLFSGGVNKDEDIQVGILREVIEESGLYDFEYVEKIGQAFTHYFNTLRKVNRVALATCFLVILKSTDLKPVQLEEHEKFSLVWATAEEILADWRATNENKDNDHWIYFMEKSISRIKELEYDTP